MTTPATDNKKGAPVQTGDSEERRVPRHVAIIMDGNGRWAEEHNLPRTEGHRAGYENIRGVVGHIGQTGVEYVTLFAFSTENWDRPGEEVAGILDLAREVVGLETEALHRNNVRVLHAGRMDRLPRGLQTAIRDAIHLTRNNTGLTLCVAFDYGGRAEIVNATRKIVEDALPPDEITEDSIASRLFTHGLPDPDLVIRTGSEFRISNFLLWQSAYAEFYSAPVNWPDFNETRIDAALDEFARRERRFGRVR